MYIHITDRNSLPLYYELIRMAEAAPGGISQEKEQLIINLKKEIRAFYRRENEFDGEQRVIRDDGFDGAIELVKLPEWLESIEDATEWFKIVRLIVPTPSPYDCTGRMFSVWFKIFERQGRFWAYHKVAFDV